MQRNLRIAGIALISFGLASFLWVYLESSPQRLGFEDTDDPALGVAFVRAYPAVYVQSGLVLLGMAISLTLGVLAGQTVVAQARGIAVRFASVFGLFAAAFFLATGAVRIGGSGPLQHFAGLRAEWGEAAYLTVQIMSQALLIVGVLGLCIWAVTTALVGWRARTLPTWLVIMAILPAIRIVSATLGPLDAVPEGSWVLSILSIFGTFIWCLAFGIVLVWRGLRRPDVLDPVSG